MNCNSHHVVYVIHCTACRINYIGCTIRKLKTRVAEHIADIRNVYGQQSGASRHFSTIHEGKFDTLQVYAIEHVYKPLRGGDWRQKLLNREAFWILRLGSRTPEGMNMRNDLMYIHQ